MKTGETAGHAAAVPHAPKASKQKKPKKLHKKQLPHTTTKRHMALNAAQQKYLSQSLALPNPAYPLRPTGGSVAMEASVREQISTKLYQQQLHPHRAALPGEDPNVTLYRQKIQQKNKPTKRTRLPYRLHDGPPFANGDLHMGHFLNKSLKDISNRYKLARGYRVEFYPGWDTHGLPIELKAVEATLKKAGVGGDKKNKNKKQEQDAEEAAAAPADEGEKPVEIPTEFKSPVTGAVLWGAHTPSQYHPNKKQIEIRDIAMKFAQQAILRQKQNMLDWSLLGDFTNPYITMDPTFEAAEILVLGNLIEKNSLYRQLMPVYWSPSSKTALAESELEYKDITSTAVYVCMPLVQHGGLFSQAPTPIIKHNGKAEVNPESLSLLIWTTTPWTLPANRGICVAPDGDYAHVKAETTTTIVLNKQVYDLVETKNVVMIEGQVEALSETWKSMSGINIENYKKVLKTHPETGHVDMAQLPAGLKLKHRGEYNVEEFGTKAVVTKGKNKGDVLDLVLTRDVTANIVQGGVKGASLDQCAYISPLSLRLRNYLMQDSEKCIDLDVENIDTFTVREKTDADLSADVSTTTKLSLPVHKVIPADHVLADQGSGCVHTAPAHGEEDYQVGVQHALPVACPVDEKGEYLPEVGRELQGVPALEGGSKKICNFLQENSAMLHREEYEHRYPHDWRTLKPVMLRATSQWFCKLDDAKQVAKNSLENVFVTTENARNRLTSFIDSRDKWCISRQRYWGLPIPVFYNKENRDDVLHSKDTTLHLSSLYSVLGTQAWWSLPAWRLLPPAHRGKVNPKYLPENGGMALEDIVDNYLKQHDIPHNNVESVDVALSKNKYDYTNNDTMEEMNNNDSTTTTGATGKKAKKVVTHINGEAVVGLPEDYYECSWNIGEDTVDVWLDSGSSWFSALYAKLSQSHLDGGYFDGEEDSNNNQHNNLYKTLKKKQEEFDTIQQQEGAAAGEQFDPYATIFGELSKIQKKDHKKLIGSDTLQVDGDVDELSWQADLYVEGSDQHRGWFQSSLLLSSLLTGHAPFKALHSHGFVVDESGRKMSKSLGNGVEPGSIILEQGHGVDVLRCWAASVDCSRDAMMSKTSIQNTIDFVRKWRGAMRFTLGCLSHTQRLPNMAEYVEQNKALLEASAAPGGEEQGEKQKRNKKKSSEDSPTTPQDASQQQQEQLIIPDWDFNPQKDLVKYDNLHILDKYILHQLHTMLHECEVGYQHYQFHKVFSAVKHFLQQPLSSVYFDLSKDRLYSNTIHNQDKKAALTTLYYVFNGLLKVMQPVLPHLTQELFTYLPKNIQNAVIQGLPQANNAVDTTNLDTTAVANSGWVETNAEWKNDVAVEHFETIMNIRASVNQCLEICRQKNTPQPAAATAAPKKNKKQQEGNADATTTDATTAVAAQPIHQVVGDHSTIPRIGSSNEAEVVITIKVPKGYQNNTENAAAHHKILNILTESNKSSLHELFMVSGTTVNVEYYEKDVAAKTQDENNDAAPSTTTTTNTQSYFIKEQENSHNTAEKRVIVETTTPLSKDQPDVLLTVGVAKHAGHKCPRCWRYSSPHDTISAMVKDSFSNPQNIQTLFANQLGGQTDAIINSMVYKSFIPSTISTVEALEKASAAANDVDVLCKRCDDFFVGEVGESVQAKIDNAI